MSRTHKSLSAISSQLNIHPKKMFTVLANEGWIIREDDEWKLTPLGISKGGETRAHTDTSKGTYIVWPVATAMVEIREVVSKTLRSDPSGNTEVSPDQPKATRPRSNFRQRFRSGTKYRAEDGHYVRSRAELVIDNWLHHAGITHVYEKKLPISDEVYCDFYLPDRDLYIEYWGYKDQKYTARMEEKRDAYCQNSFQLIELDDGDLTHLDDVLSIKLTAAGYAVATDERRPTKQKTGLYHKLRTLFIGKDRL